MGNLLARCKYGNQFLKKKAVDRHSYQVDGVPIGVEYRIYNRGSKSVSRNTVDTGSTSASQHRESRNIWQERVRQHGDDCNAMKDGLDNDRQRIRSSIKVLKSESNRITRAKKAAEFSKKSDPDTDETIFEETPRKQRRSSTCNPEIDYPVHYKERSHKNAREFVENVNNETQVEGQGSKQEEIYYYEDNYANDNYYQTNA